MNVLLVEDEVKQAMYLKKGLSELGISVDVADNGTDGLHMALQTDYDVIILDRMLPGIDGMTLLKSLRGHKNTPVIMLTAVGSVDDRVEGLTEGADDYLTKPYAFSELVARVRLLSRRSLDSSIEDRTILQYADLEMNLISRRVTRGESLIRLTVKEFSVLEILLRRQGSAVSRTVLAEIVWGMNFDSGTNVVDVAIKRLRTKIDVPFEKPLVHSERGIGYILELR